MTRVAASAALYLYYPCSLPVQLSQRSFREAETPRSNQRPRVIAENSTIPGEHYDRSVSLRPIPLIQNTRTDPDPDRDQTLITSFLSRAQRFRKMSPQCETFELLGGIALAQAIPPIATHFSVVWSVCLFVCLSSVTFVHPA